MRSHIYSIFVIALVLITPAYLNASPGSSDKVNININGTNTDVFLYGDESFHWFQNTSGNIIQKQSDNSWSYVNDADSNGVFEAVNSNADSGLPNQNYFNQLKANNISKLQSYKALSAKGSLKNLVILAAFDDHFDNLNTHTLSSANNNITDYNTLFNTSFKSYFSEVSSGTLSINSSITNWVRLKNNEEYYGSDSLPNLDLKKEELVQDAINAALADPEHTNLFADTLANYDFVTIIHSGLEQSRADVNSLTTGHLKIWGSSGNLSTPLKIGSGNLNFGLYLTGAALGGTNNTQVTDLGPLCHNMAHLLGLPDLYDYPTQESNQNNGFGIGNYGLMGTGAWGASGNTETSTKPVHLSAWSKVRLGHVTPTSITSSSNLIQLGPIEGSSIAVHKWSSSGNQYFLGEYISGSGFNSDRITYSQAGLLIWHIYEDAFSNSASNIIHPLVKLEEADANNSLSLAQKQIDKNDIWLSGSFGDNINSLSNSHPYELNSYYLRSTGNTAGNILIDNISLSNNKISYRFRSKTTEPFIANSTDFGLGKISWYDALDPSSGYVIERDSGTGFQVIAGDNIIYTSTTYTDPAAVGSVEFKYRIRLNNESNYGPEFIYALKALSSLVSPNSSLLSLSFNTLIDNSATAIDLSKIYLLDNTGANLFQLRNDKKTNYLYPNHNNSNTDTIGSLLIPEDSPSQNLNIKLSYLQLYELINKADQNISNLSVGLAPGAVKVFTNGGANIFNIVQSTDNNNQVRLSSVADSTSPEITAVSYNNKNKDISIFFNEPIFNTLNPEQVTITAPSSLDPSTGKPYGTNLSLAGNTIAGNQISITPNASQLVRLEILYGFNNSLGANIPIGFTEDYSKNSSANTEQFNIKEIISEELPFIRKFSINNHELSRRMDVEFSEPIFFLNDTPPSEASPFQFTLSTSANNFSTNTLSVNGNSLNVLLNDAETFAGKTFRAADALSVSLSEAQADEIDDYYGLFTFPAPATYLKATGNIYMDSLNYFQAVQINNVDINHVTSSANYLPRRRAKWIRPLDHTSNLNRGLNWKEDPNWKGFYLLKYVINGGWRSGDNIRLEWDNAELETNYYMGTPDIMPSDNLQEFIWATTDHQPSPGYVLKLYSTTGTNTLYSFSKELELDNKRPTVSISYETKTTPTYKANAIDDVKIKATYSEPMIDIPIITITQQGSVVEIGNMYSESGNLTMSTNGTGLYSDNIFYYDYDIKEQDGVNYIDGAASLTLNSIRDRAKGDNLFTGLPEDHPDLEGNRSLPISDQSNHFSIDTVPPSVSSLEFNVEDDSIIEEQSTLKIFFSEDMLNSQTPFENGRYFTQILNHNNYQLTGSATTGLNLEVIKVEGSGTGPYTLTLNRGITRGQLNLIISPNTIRDFHGNFVKFLLPIEASWPGPLISTHPVILSPGGRTRLLLTGGFLPYELNINEYYSNQATVATDLKSILGHGFGPYTIEIKSRNRIRYVNTFITPPQNNSIKGQFTKFRDELDFKLVSFPFDITGWKGEGLMNLLQDQIGTHGEDYILYYYKKSQEDDGYMSITKQSTEVGPGYGFWMASRKDKNIDMTRQGPSNEQVVGLDAHFGWNLIGNPWDEDLDIDQIYVSTSATRFKISDTSQSETGHHLWYSDIENPLYVSLNSLPAFTAAWLYVDNPAGAEILFFKDQENFDLGEIDYEPLNPDLHKRSKLDIRSTNKTSGEPYPPARPSSFSHSTSVDSNSSGGGGGCLLK